MFAAESFKSFAYASLHQMYTEFKSLKNIFIGMLSNNSGYRVSNEVLFELEFLPMFFPHDKDFCSFSFHSLNAPSIKYPKYLVYAPPWHFQWQYSRKFIYSELIVHRRKNSSSI